MSGINLNSTRYQSISQNDIERTLKDYGIPTDQDIVFTLGRLEKYKGFDQAIYFFNEARSTLNNPHMIILGLSYFQDNPVVKQIKELITKFDIDATFYTRQDMKLPLLLWQWHKTKYSLNLSKAEPFGMAPIEARYLSGLSKGPLVVTSNNGGLAEQCENKINGLKVEYGDIDEYKEIIKFVNSLSNKEYNKFRSECANHVTKCYNASKNILEHFKLLGIL
ncbi:MAG: glycosyltransferase [Candidatus Dojkabacteria bacterium]|jgi:glycosyltransferase involved in cell wall biosynthesis